MAQGSPQGNTTSIPKFKGFRGKKASDSTPAVSSEDGGAWHISGPAKPSETPDERTQSLDEEESGRRRLHRHKDDRHRHHHKHKKRPTEKSPEPTSLTVEPWDCLPGSFFIDRRGDPANVTYGTLHKYNVPSYTRNGRGIVLGLPMSQRIDRVNSDERQIHTSDLTPLQPGRRDKLIFKKFNNDDSRVTFVQASATTTQEDYYHHEYIQIPDEHFSETTLKGVTDPDLGLETAGGEIEDVYRFHEGRSKSSIRLEQTPGAAAQLPTEDAASTKHDLEAQMRLTKAKLAHVTVQRPADGQAWIDLIDFEDELLYHGKGTTGSRVSAAEKGSTAEIKLSMYEKSLKTVVDSTYRERLLLGMLREGSKLWDPKRTSDKWQEALRNNPGYISLWIEFLNFQQTNYTKFRASHLQQCFKDCLATLDQAAQKAKPNESARNTRMLQTYTLLRSTLFLLEAGWADLSVGIWQAVLEFNIRRPLVANPLNMDDSSLKGSFEEFWESEVARIGEEGSAGWTSFHVHNGDPLESQNAQTPIEEGKSPHFHTWSTRERLLGFQSRMPARTIDDEASDDPYRVIMYQDIAPYLFVLPNQEVQEYLIPAFLAYCHLPPPLNILEKPRGWWADSFVRNEALHPIKDQWKFWRRQNSLDQSASRHETMGDAASKVPAQFAFPIPNLLTSSDTLFSIDWFDAFRSWKMEFSDDKGPIETDWILRTLKAFVDSSIGSDELAEYLIAFESHTSPGTARKTAKAILKKRSTSLRLYNAYALLEFRSEEAAKARDILTSTILKIEHLPLPSRKEVVLLWRTRTWIALDTEGRNAAGSVLGAFSHNGFSSVPLGGEGPAMSTTAVLKAQQAMLAMRSDLMRSDPLLAAVLIELLCLMTYADPRNQASPLEAYLSTFTKYTTDHPPPILVLELLHQSRAKLLYHHATHAPSFRPSALRAALAESIRLFPHNTAFLSLYAWNEARFRVDDRVRAVVRDVLMLQPPSSSSTSSATSTPNVRTESVAVSFFSIYAELSRSLTAGSNVHSVRAAFERAVDSSSCGSKSAGLWKLFVLFEVHEGGGNLEKAKTVFYRAVQAVPWAKEIYMLAFEDLRGVMGEEELKGLVEWMVDGRGLRVFGAEGI